MKETLGDRHWGTLLLKPVLSMAALPFSCVNVVLGTTSPGCYPIVPFVRTIYPTTLVMEAAFASPASFQPLSTTLAFSLLNSGAATPATLLADSLLQPSQRASAATSLLFIDAGVSDYQSLLAGVQPGTEIHLLNSAQDAIAQITQALLGRTNIASLHIVSHGQAGGLELGNRWLSWANLRSYSSELQSWGNALTDDADILLYGCDVGEGAIGHAFVQQLAQLTGADIAASDDLTGSAALGGDWTLEVNTGAIAAPLAFLPTKMQSYGGVLDDAIFASAQQFTGGALASGSKTSVDGTGNVYTVGSFTGTVDFDPGAGAFALTSTGGYDIFISKLDANGNFVWAKSMGGNSNDFANDISVDSSGNVYATGSFAGTADFDPGTGTTNLISAGNSDVFVSKLDASGNFVWAKGMGSIGDDFANGISVDGNGNVYTTGGFFDTADFDPGTGTTNLTSAGSVDIFISKLDVSGKLVWAKRLGGSDYDQANGISVDSSGNIYTTGYFFGTADFDPGIGTTNLTSTSAGNSDVFVSKLDASGNFVWAKNMGGSSGDFANGISVDGSGNVYTTGYFQGTADFDPGVSTTNLTSAGNSDVFVSKLDASGNFVWAKGMGGSGDDVAYDISVDGSGNVYTTGYFVGTADFDPGTGTTNLISAGNQDIFVSKLDTSGNFVWAKRLGGDSNESAYGISVDSNGNVYTTGYFINTVDFDPGAGLFNLTTGGTINIFLSKLNAAGNFVQAQQFTAGSFTASPYSPTPKSFVDGRGSVYTVGSFTGTIDFDPGPGTFTLTSASNQDIFVSKLDVGGNFVWAKRLGGGSSLDISTSISVDGSGNVYTTGYFQGTADFDPGVGNTNLVSTLNSYDIFVSKLDANGNFVWAKSMGGSSVDSATSISVDSNGNVYTTGYFQGTADFDPGTGTTNLTSTGNNDIFISKLDANGNFVWAKRLGGSGDDRANDIRVDGSGNVYTTGYFVGTADFDPSAGTLNLASSGGNDIFISKLDANGNLVWAKSMGGSGNDRANGISVDGSGNVYTTGSFVGTADFDPGTGTTNLISAGGNDIFVSKLDANGNLIWVKGMGGSGGDDQAADISVDGSGNIYTTGTFVGTVDFDSGTGTANLTSAGYSDVFVSKLDANGNLVWVKGMGGLGIVGADSISVDSIGNVYTTGTFIFTVDFDPGRGIYNLNTGSETNIFLSKLSQVPAPTVSLSASSASLNEGNGTTAYTFTVNLSNTSAQTVSVNYATADGTATVADNDYTAVSGVLTFNPGETSKTITVNVNGDAKVEPDETFLVKLLNPTNATLAPNANTGTGTIVNDDQANLLWRNSSSGQNAVWQLNNFTVQSSYFLPTVLDANWQIASSTADFNQDGFTDILWRNQRTGENAIWELNRTGYQTSYLITRVADLNWQIAGTADFNHDGTPDIIWRNQTSGQNSVWQQRGASLQSSYLLPTVTEAGWQIVATTADFNRDGVTDLLWRNQVTGANAIWQMSSTGYQTSFFITPVADTNWRIVGTGDFNGDGTADIVWRNQSTGDNAIWQMQGGTLQSGYLLTRVAATNWQIAGVADLGGDSTPELLWRNQQAGKAMIWQLSGFSYGQASQLPDTLSEWSVRPFAIT